jgi:hypothetical protein
MSLPKQCGCWAATKAAYRLLSHPEVTPGAILGPHTRLTRQRCVGHPLVLCVQDTTEMNFTAHAKVKGLGRIGDGHGRGFEQHATLAVTPGGRLIGVLDAHYCLKTERPEGETRTQMESRWSMGDLWPDAVNRAGPGPEGCRFVHVADRGGDCFGMMRACKDRGVGFLIRARSDRHVEDHATKLWSHAEAGVVAGTKSIKVRRHKSRPGSVPRTTGVEVRFTPVRIDAPARSVDRPIDAWAVHVKEPAPPKDEEAVEWLLLTSEPLTTPEAALQAVCWYQRRWVIEEWHKAQKDACRLEASQLDDRADLERLAAVLGVVAVWLLQLRDMARADGPEADDPVMLRSIVPPAWIRVVARMSKQKEAAMTPRTFFMALARRGGFLGRTHDGHPGWKTVYLGWADYAKMVEFVESEESTPQTE